MKDPESCIDRMLPFLEMDTVPCLHSLNLGAVKPRSRALHLHVSCDKDWCRAVIVRVVVIATG